MSIELFRLLVFSLWETTYMILISGAVAVIFGIPLGVILLTTRKDGLYESVTFNRILGVIVNALRSIPFIILLIAIVPFTRMIVGTSIGTAAAIVPLSIGAIPFLARIIESAINEVDPGLVEAGQAMGASSFQIVYKILIPEARAGIINAITITMVALVGYSAMAGAVGGGGLGDLAISYGYQRFNTTVMISTVVILIVFVQVLQIIGDYFASKR